MSKKKVRPKVFRTSWKLLSEWYHADAGATEEEILDVVVEDGTAPTSNRRLIAQRLFGGFDCIEEVGASHIFHDTGAYTYTGLNTDHSADYRKRVWDELLEANSDQPFVENAPFTSDRPTLPKKKGE